MLVPWQISQTMLLFPHTQLGNCLTQLEGEELGEGQGSYKKQMSRSVDVG